MTLPAQVVAEDPASGSSPSNLITIASSLCLLLFAHYSRRGLLEVMSPIALVDTFAMAVALISLPTFATTHFARSRAWFQSDAFFTTALLVLLALAGHLLHGQPVWPTVLLWPIATFLICWELFRLSRAVGLLTQASGLVMMALLALILYSRGFHSALFLEKIVLGEAHLDILFHTAISNMFSTVGWSATGFDGAPYYAYHWASHALFAGLRHWAPGTTTLTFYNISYPSLFIPLFVKTLFLFANELAEFRGEPHPSLDVAVFVVAFVYSIGLPAAHPFLSESLCVSLVLSFSFLASVLIYGKSARSPSVPFCVYSVGVLLLITFCKISTGFVLCAAMSHLVVRTTPNRRGSWIVVVVGSVIGLLSYLLVVPKGSDLVIRESTSYARRYYNLWRYSTGFLTYWLGAVVGMVAGMARRPLTSWSVLRQAVRSKEALDLEFLVVMTVAGFGAATVVSSDPSDVYFFGATQLFVSFGYLILAAQAGCRRLMPCERARSVMLFVVVVMCLMARPDTAIPIRSDLVGIRSRMEHLSPPQQMLHELVGRLLDADNEPDKQSACVYIGPGESWYFDSQSYRPQGAPFVVPALSGIPLIGGVPEKIVNSELVTYGYGQYRLANRPRIRDLEMAKAAAARGGYKLLIHYSGLSGRLVETRYAIKAVSGSTSQP